MSRAAHSFFAYLASAAVMASHLACLAGCDNLKGERSSRTPLDTRSPTIQAGSAISSDEHNELPRVPPGTALLEADFKRTLRATGAEFVVVQVYLDACGACMTEALQLTKMQAQWRNDGVAILGIGMDETPKGAEAFFNSMGGRITYPLYFSPWFAKQQQVLVTPTVFIYSSNGKQLHRTDAEAIGTNIASAIGEKLAELLAKR